LFWEIAIEKGFRDDGHREASRFQTSSQRNLIEIIQSRIGIVRSHGFTHALAAGAVFGQVGWIGHDDGVRARDVPQGILGRPALRMQIEPGHRLMKTVGADLKQMALSRERVQEALGIQQCRLDEFDDWACQPMILSRVVPPT